MIVRCFKIERREFSIFFLDPLREMQAEEYWKTVRYVEEKNEVGDKNQKSENIRLKNLNFIFVLKSKSKNRGWSKQVVRKK